MYFPKQPTKPITKQAPRTTNQPTDPVDALLDEPCVNPRYGGMTMRQVIKKVVLRKNKPEAAGFALKFEIVEKKQPEPFQLFPVIPFAN